VYLDSVRGGPGCDVHKGTGLAVLRRSVVMVDVMRGRAWRARRGCVVILLVVVVLLVVFDRFVRRRRARAVMLDGFMSNSVGLGLRYMMRWACWSR
jgi:hypothetical protein